MKTTFCSTLALASVLAATQHATAQSSDPRPAASAQAPTGLRIEEVYVHAGAPAPGSKMVQAANIDLLQGLDKELRQGASLGQTLEHLPGLRTLDTGNNAGVPVIRGLTGNRIRILSNGVGVDFQQYGIRHQPHIDPFLSDSIEVVRGAASLLYGSDAIGGVIDVHSLDLSHSDDGSRHSKLDTRIDYASNNNQRDVAVRGSSSSDRWAVGGGVVVRSGDNIEAPDSATAFESGDSSGPAFTGELPFTDFEQVNGQLGASWRGEQSTTSVRLTRWTNEMNYLLPNPPNGAGIGIDLENTELQLSTDYRIDGGKTQWTLRPKLVWQNNLRRANEPGNPRSVPFDGDIEIEFDQYIMRFEAVHEGGSLLDRGTLGVELRTLDQESRGRTVLSPGATTRNFGVFAYEERRLGLLVLQGGLRYDYSKVEGDADKTTADPGFTGTVGNSYNVVTGALGGTYPLGDHFTLAANAARGFRAPSVFELFANGVHGGVAAVQIGNPDLDPEESLNVDLGLRWSFDRLTGSATVYENRIDNYIYLQDSFNQAPNGLPIFEHRQADATLRGFEAEMALDLGRSWGLRLVVDLIETENRASGENLPLTPANELLTELSWSPASLGVLRAPYARASVRYADSQDAAPGEPFAQFDRNPVFGSASTDSYWLFDLAAGFQFQGFGERDIRVNVELRNVLDETYRDFLNTYKAYALNPGRDLRLTLEIPLG
ncbi:MAG: TonB-dependent receptor [Halieaceae bacterium]|jgi:iron complex outermembrane receptor protein/hemoglobin/transferrin/lactoferrin receptor protein|nr:TonB-dependent receptor [Halieaceae bacterium]